MTDEGVDFAQSGIISLEEGPQHEHFHCLLTCRALEKSASPEDKPPAKEVLLYREELFQKLGWQHWALQEESRIKECFPSAYPLF